MKYIIVTDTHLGIKKGNDIYLQCNINLFYTICKYAKDNNIPGFIHAGDFFDTRKSLSLKVIEIAQLIMSNIENTFDSIYMIIGNHDTYLKNQIYPSSLSIFKEHEKVVIIDKPYLIGNMVLIPWLFDKKVLDMDADTCIGHFDINGIEMNSSGFIPLHQNLNISDFKNFKKVFSGHYHVSSQNSNIKYLGSPMQFTFNEINQTTGFYVYDSKTLKLDFIEFNNYPKHVIFNENYDPSESEIKNNNVKLIFTKDYGFDKNTSIINNITAKKPNSLKIVYFDLNDTMTNENIEDSLLVKSKQDILFDFYKKSDLPDGIKYDILKKIVNNLSKEIKGD